MPIDTPSELSNKTQVADTRDRIPMRSLPRILTLPREIRDMIYMFALPEKIQMTVWDNANEEISTLFLRGIGDPAGVFLNPPTQEEVSLLGVNNQIRSEVLHEVIRRCHFRVVHRQVIQLLLSIGRLGRENIESLEIKWAELEMDSDVDQYPAVHHQVRYIELLRQCKRLRCLRLIFPSPSQPNPNFPDELNGDPTVSALISPFAGLGMSDIELHVKFEIGYNVTGDEPKVVAFLQWLDSVLKPRTFHFEKVIQSYHS